MTYNTKQKDKILDIIKNKTKEFSVYDIYLDLNKEVGETTIYRYINKLVEANKLEKIVRDNTSYYQYLSSCDNNNHFYLKCERCGKLIHIDCDCINEFYSHISDRHNFILNKNRIIIYGICNKCNL